MRKPLRVVVLSTIVALVTTLTGTPAAQASTTGSAPEVITPLAGECGSSYSLVGFYSVQNDITDALEGHMEIYYSSSLRRNCAIMRHAGAMWGKRTNFPTGTFVTIRASGGSWQSCPLGATNHKTQCDRGQYSFYAGPVYTPAGVNMSGRCIDFAGNVGLQTHISRTGVHCG